MTGFLGFTERNNFGNSLFPIIPLGEVQNFNLLPVNKWQPILGLPFSDWSVSRRLWDQYTGNLIEVRRDSDNATTNISYGADNGLDIATLLGFVGAGSGYIRTIYDQSGASNNFVQTTLANQPRIVNTGTLETRNGLPAAFFDGTNDNMAVPASTATYDWMHNLVDANFMQYLFAVAQFNSGTGGNTIMATNDGITSVARLGFTWLINTSVTFPGFTVNRNVLGAANRNITFAGTVAVPLDQLIVTSVQSWRAGGSALERLDSYTNQAAVDKNNTATLAAVNGNSTFNLHLGQNGASGIYLNGYFCEAFMYRHPINQTLNLSPYNADLQTYYNIP